MDLIENNKFQNAFLIYVSIDLFYEKNELENDYDEFKSLVISSGLEIKDCRNFNQKIPSINTFITKGNLENLKLQILDKDIDILIINHELNASQTRNLEKYFNKRVIDKTELILDIFASRASSHTKLKAGRFGSSYRVTLVAPLCENNAKTLRSVTCSFSKE